jgi:hypothetical protein
LLKRLDTKLLFEEINMAICQNCHKTIPDDATTCEFCGAQQSAVNLNKEETPDSQPTPESKEQTYPGPQPTTESKEQTYPGPQPTTDSKEQTYPGPQPPNPPQQQPYPGQQAPVYAYPPHYGADAMYPPGSISPKNRDVVMLLCFFLGFIGAHRFYLGKIGTGILMILTIGGLGIWVLVDFFISVFGKYTDSEGRYVDPTYTKGLATFLLIWIGLGALIWIILVVIMFVSPGSPPFWM